MLNKTKKVAFLTTGLAGALVVSSAVGIALSSCTTTDTSSSNKPNKYTYSIDWTDQSQLKQLTIDEQGLVYSSADKTEIITVAPNTAATSFVIPASVKYITGYNEITRNSSGAVATSTSKGAFQDQTSLISITFASNDTLISIGDSSFKGCTYLSSITLPTSTTVVYNSAFENCTNLRDIGLTNVSYIGTSAFKNAIANGADVSINLSATTYIGDEAFSGSTSLANVDLSSNTTLTYIGKSAFKNSLVSGSSATTIDLSKASVLKTISDGAFQNATNLGTVVLPATSVLTTIGANAFNGATSLTQVGSTANTFTAPSSLGNYAATTATTAVPSYVTSGIGANAFSGTKITTIDLSAINTATPLGNAAFKGMTSLASVNFGTTSKITTIPYSLFENDSALTTLTLPASITTIRDGNYNDDAAASTTYVNQKSPFYNSGLVTIDMSNVTSYATGTTTWNAVSINNTTMLPVKLFQNLTSLTTVTLKTGTVVIGENAFNGATSLTTVKEGTTSTIAGETDGEGLIISSSLEMINTNAFNGSGIKKVGFANTAENANNLWFVGQGAFQNATALTSVDLSHANTQTLHTINNSAYKTPTSGTGSESSGYGLYSVSSNSFTGASALKNLTLPTSTATIYESAFVNNTALASVNFDQLTNLNAIESNNFNNTALTTIDFSNITDSSRITNLSSWFTNATANLFNNLPVTAIVKLPAAMTLNNNNGLSSTVFTIQGSTTSNILHSSIDYPNGFDVTTKSLTSASINYTYIGATSSGATGDNTLPTDKMLEYVSDSFNLASSSNGQNIQEYYPKTFFGNTKLKSLTLSAKNLYKTTSSSGTETYSQQDSLFIHLRGGTTSNTFTGDYFSTKYLPFGNNSALTDLVFTNFDINTSPTYPNTSDTDNTKITDNPLYKTTTKTWAQVATIINKFASNNTNTPTRWVTPTNNQISQGFNADSVVSVNSTSGSSGNYVVTISNVNSPNSSNTGPNDSVNTSFTVTVPNSMPAAQEGQATDVHGQIFYHNGVKWTLTIYSAKHKTNPGAITLVGENINVYKASRPNGNTSANDWQICFNQGTEASSKITVTLNICPPTTNSK